MPDAIRRFLFVCAEASRRARNQSVFQICQGIVLPFFEISPNSIGEHRQPASVCSLVYSLRHVYACTRVTSTQRTHTRSYTNGCSAQARLPSSFKGLTDDRHGTGRRRVRIHHIFYVPTVGLYTPFPVHWRDQAQVQRPFQLVAPTHFPEDYF